MNRTDDDAPSAAPSSENGSTGKSNCGPAPVARGSIVRVWNHGRGIGFRSVLASVDGIRRGGVDSGVERAIMRVLKLLRQTGRTMIQKGHNPRRPCVSGDTARAPFPVPQQRSSGAVAFLLREQRRVT